MRNLHNHLSRPTIVFEDDFAPLEHNFKPLVDNFIKALPSGYHIGYLDTWIMEGGITPLPGNRNHIAQFMSNSKWYGTWAVVLSKKFITEILSTTHYYGMQDEMLLERANNNQLDVYVSSIKLASISSFELTGQSKNSEISKMGFRADHPCMCSAFRLQNSVDNMDKFCKLTHISHGSGQMIV